MLPNVFIKPIKCAYDKTYAAPENDTDMPKHVAVLKDYTDMFVECPRVWFLYLSKLYSVFEIEVFNVD